MPYGFYVSAEGAHAQNTRLDVIANNLANIDTVGFKRQLALFQARHAEAIEEGLVAPGTGGIDDIGGGVMVEETKTDYSIAPWKHTKIPTDVAIRGDEGFFVVQKDDEEFLTRAGNFQITVDGRLTTPEGYSVLNSTGAPIVVNPFDPVLEIDHYGNVRQTGLVQELALVKPESLDELVRMGENLFKPLSDPQPLPPNERGVASGYLETSGVRATWEMTEMVKAARMLEANVNLMKTQDEMLGGLVNRVMRTR
ncbi:MAG: flagellar hook basal-body protein [Pirellulales bacterium]|nr:flagellar hook basal-body protein [Pirellulales bacterium]